MRISRSTGAWRALLIAPLVTMALVGNTDARAQDQVRVAVTGGVASDQRGVSSRALAVAPTMYFVSSSGSLFSLDGNVTRYNNQAQSMGVGAALVARDRIGGPFFLALDASGNASRLTAAGASASFFTAGASPVVELVAGSMTFFGGGRVGVGRIMQEASRRLVPGPGGNSTSVSATRTGAGPSGGFTFTQSPTPGEVVRLAGRGDQMIISGERITDWTLSLAMVNSAATFGGTLGTREAPDEHGPFGGASLSVNLNSSVNLIAAAGHYARDRLTGALPGKYFSLGFTFGAPRQTDAKAPGPPVRGVARLNDGFTRFSIDAADASSVEIAGDFSDWKPMTARRAANGVWYVDVRLKPGQYRYAFRVNGKDWRVPRGATAVDDGFGGKSAWITVG